jgi:hypothetical protein
MFKLLWFKPLWGKSVGMCNGKISPSSDWLTVGLVECSPWLKTWKVETYRQLLQPASH